MCISPQHCQRVILHPGSAFRISFSPASVTVVPPRFSVGKRFSAASSFSLLTPDEREILIGQALEILDKVYAHLPLKRALHANDPIQSLRLLRLRQAGLDERAFHSAMMDVFLGLRDLHTNYILPSAY